MNKRWRKHPQIPILIRGLQYAVLSLLIAYVFLSMAIDLMGFGRLVGVDALMYLQFGLLASVAIYSVAGYYAWQSITSCEFNVCPCCEYALRGLPASAQCPECGELYEREKVQAHWKECFVAAAKYQPCLRLSPIGMRQYTRYSIWLFLIAGMCFGVGMNSGRFSLYRNVEDILILAALAILFVQLLPLPLIIARLHKA
jgi:hypothetical protein